MTDDNKNLAVPFHNEIMPATLRTGAETSITLRGVQAKLAELLTNDNYIALIAAGTPEVLPALLDSVTNAVATADNLLIRMAQVAEKNASMNKVFELLVKKEETRQKELQLEGKDKYYDENVEKIKLAILKGWDAERDGTLPDALKDLEETSEVTEEPFKYAVDYIEE